MARDYEPGHIASAGVSANRISVGASFPARLGTVTAIWPCGVLVIGETGLGVDVRPGAFKRFLLRFVDSGRQGDAAIWSAPWSELAPVDIGPLSVVLRTEGSRGCRVVLVRRRQLQLLLAELTSRGIQIRRVRTTFGWYVRSRPSVAEG